MKPLPSTLTSRKGNRMHNKIQKEFEKRKEYEFQETFDFYIAYGMCYRCLQVVLYSYFDSFYASPATIRRYAQERGLFQRRKTAQKARKKRPFHLQRKSDSLELYRKLFT